MISLLQESVDLNERVTPLLLTETHASTAQLLWKQGGIVQVGGCILREYRWVHTHTHSGQVHAHTPTHAYMSTCTHTLFRADVCSYSPSDLMIPF